MSFTQDIRLTRTYEWMTHSDESKRAYLTEMLDSKFVLCPRGNGPSTYRLFETMQLGRVPVIISDDWVPPDGPAWSEFSIRVSESRLQELPEIVARYEPFASEMGAEARAAWERWFAPDVLYLHMLRAIDSICLERPADHNEGDRPSWPSFRARWKLGWTAPQKVYGAAVTGQLVERTNAHFKRFFLRRQPQGSGNR